MKDEMSVRDQFAAAALVMMGENWLKEFTLAETVEHAFYIADAMMDERAKTQVVEAVPIGGSGTIVLKPSSHTPDCRCPNCWAALKSERDYYYNLAGMAQG